MLKRDFSWICNIEQPLEIRADKLSEVTGPYIFGGTAVVNSDLEIGKNGWGVPDEELNGFANTFPGSQLRVDHGKSVRDIVGKVHRGSNDKGILKFVAELGDQNLADKVKAGYIDHVSISATADSVTCSACGKETRPKRTCACEKSHELIRGLRLRELSLIADPAFDSAKIVPISFSAALNEALTEEVKVAEVPSDVIKMSQENKEMKTLETKVVPTVTATTEKPAGSEDSKVLLADKMESITKRMEEAVTKYQQFWDEAPKREQAFWEQRKKECECKEEAKKEEAKEECKKEEAWPKKEDESKKEESRPGPTPITPIETPSVITSKPPTIVKKFAEDEEEAKEEAKASAPPLQAKTDTSEDTVPLKATVPTDPTQLLAAALGDIRRAAKKAEILVE